MITNICAFLLCLLAIMSSIKITESAGSKIVPIRFFAQTSNEEYARTVNSLITFSKNPITLTPAEQTILSTPAWETFDDYILKLKSRDKLEKKAKEIRCSFCVIAKSNILRLIEKFKSEKAFINDEVKLDGLKEEAEIVLHLLLLANLETGKWLWSYYLKVVAISQYEDNFPFVRENPFEDDQLQTGVSDFIDGCIAEKYLPATSKQHDLISKKPNVREDLFCVLRNSRTVTNMFSRRIPVVRTDFLYLKPFWDEDEELLFGRVTEFNVDWSAAKQRHKAEVVRTKEFVENHAWIYTPYGRLDHQQLLVGVLDARMYCYISVILYVYVRQLTMLTGQTLTTIRDFIYNIMHYVLNLTAFKDEFLVIVVSEFNFAGIRDIEDITDISARVKAKANEILNDLNGASTNRIDRLSFNVNEAKLSTDNYLIGIIKNFKDYLNELKGACLPFRYDVLLHFMDVVKTSAAQYI